MIALIVVTFIVGYVCIALEHPIKVNKTASALLLGVLLWTMYAFSMNTFGAGMTTEEWRTALSGNLVHHLGSTAEIVFFLLGAMTIVTLVDSYQGFTLITDHIKTTNKRRLLWIISILTFFFSAVLDNMTTAIVMCALLRKLIADKEERWLFGGMVILAANAGGAWSPIGDVTTIMLWIGGHVTTFNIMLKTFAASFVCLVVPVLIVGATLHGDVSRPEANDENNYTIEPKYRKLIFILGVGALVFVPVFKTITHLPPYLGMLFGLSILWIVTELINHRSERETGRKMPTAISTLQIIDTPSILFFLGILMAVACLETCGVLGSLATSLDQAFGNIKIGNEPFGFFIIATIIGVVSSIVDNVPLVAASMGMYADAFATNHPFWEYLAYCAGTGGSLLIIGSAAGVAVMGMEKIDFIWYLRKISWLAFMGFLAGAVVYIVMDITLFEKVPVL
ncbi:MAG: sodium:proton antiporter NhaD, partial [Bacteroidales bacterium]|nr:sodium:proton antiporter NhaD [Bacteroidales bacterium]